MNVIEIKSRAKEEFIDLTSKVQEIVSSSKIKSGVCLIYVPHTTAAVTINENADPDVKADNLMALNKLVPNSLPYEHSEGNSPAHVKSSLIGSSVQVIIEDGRLALGTWQGIFFCEFDGPRSRRVFVKVLG